jgi:CRP-like cAMP-binding protein
MFPISVLRQSYLFSNLTEDEVGTLAAVLSPQTADLGDYIVRQGEPGDHLFIIESGQLEASTRAGTERLVLRKMGPGEHFGEIALLTGSKRSADVQALGPTKLWKLNRADYFSVLGGKADVHQKLASGAMERAKFSERQTLLAATGVHNVVHSILDKIVRQEVRALRSADLKRIKAWSFDEIVEFYQAARFLYPSKMQELNPRFDSLRETWARLLRGNNLVFKFLCLSKLNGTESRITNSICAFRYSPSSWQIQHLVSTDRHGYTGTLIMLLALVDWFRRTGCSRLLRFTYRPDNPGVTQLFAHYAHALGPTRFHSQVSDYEFLLLDHIGQNVKASLKNEFTCTIHRADDGSVPLQLFSGLHLLELTALNLESDDWDDVEQDYGALNLVRRQRILTVRDSTGEPLAAAIFNLTSEGVNFSFLENALEYICFRPDLDRSEALAAVASLIHQASELMRAEGRDYLVLMTQPAHRDILASLGINQHAQKQYAVATFVSDAEGLDLVHDASIGYYQEHLMRNLKAGK